MKCRSRMARPSNKRHIWDREVVKRRGPGASLIRRILSNFNASYAIKYLEGPRWKSFRMQPYVEEGYLGRVNSDHKGGQWNGSWVNTPLVETNVENEKVLFKPTNFFLTD